MRHVLDAAPVVRRDSPVAAVEASIVIRTLNEARNLERLLQGLREQSYTRWEVIVVDSGSTDATLTIARRYAARIVTLEPHEFSFGRSLNLGCQHAQGRYVVLVSAHAYPMNNLWLHNLLQPFDDPSIAIVCGRQRGVASSRIAEERDLERLFGGTSKILIDEPFSHNGNAAIRRELWQAQPFDELLTGLEDVEWARSMQRRGYRVYYAAHAAVYHVHHESLRRVFRRSFREGVARRVITPGHRLSAFDVTKELAANIAGDLLFAVRRRKPLGKMLQIPGTRVAEFAGMWQATRQRVARAALALPQVTESVVVTAPGRHGVQETALPQPGSGDVLIQVAYTGVCATDVEVAEGRLEYYRTGAAAYPIVPGHEYSGVVVGIGPGVRRIRPGDRVVGECAIGCGSCASCQAGEEYRCPSRREVGVINLNGAYARHLAVPARSVHLLPRDLTLKEAALIEPVAVALKGLRKFRFHGGAACVVGAGSLGNFCAQLLKRQGLQVTVVDRDERRLRLLEPHAVNLQRDVRDVHRFDYLIDAAGSEEVLARLIEESKASAQILVLGMPHTQRVPLRLSTVPCYEKTIYGSVASAREDWREAIRLLRGRAIHVADHVATVLPLESYATAWQHVRERTSLKVLLLCNPSLRGY